MVGWQAEASSQLKFYYQAQEIVQWDRALLALHAASMIWVLVPQKTLSIARFGPNIKTKPTTTESAFQESERTAQEGSKAPVLYAAAVVTTLVYGLIHHTVPYVLPGFQSWAERQEQTLSYTGCGLSLLPSKKGTSHILLASSDKGKLGRLRPWNSGCWASVLHEEALGSVLLQGFPGIARYTLP